MVSQGALNYEIKAWDKTETHIRCPLAGVEFEKLSEETIMSLSWIGYQEPIRKIKVLLKAFLKSLTSCILRSELCALVNISNACNPRRDEGSDKSGCGFAFPVHNASAKTAICRVKNSYSLSWSHTQHYFWLKSSLNNKKKLCSGPKLWWNSLVLPCSPHPEAAGLIERWNGVLKTQLQCQLGGNTLQGWDRVLQKVVYVLNQCLIYGAVSHGQHSKVQKSWGGNGSGNTHCCP